MICSKTKNKTRKIKKNILKKTYILSDKQKEIICNRHSYIFKTFNHVIDGVFTQIVDDTASSEFNLEKGTNKHFCSYVNDEKIKNMNVKKEKQQFIKIDDFEISFI